MSRSERKRVVIIGSSFARGLTPSTSGSTSCSAPTPHRSCCAARAGCARRSTPTPLTTASRRPRRPLVRRWRS